MHPKYRRPLVRTRLPVRSSLGFHGGLGVDLQLGNNISTGLLFQYHNPSMEKALKPQSRGFLRQDAHARRLHFLARSWFGVGANKRFYLLTGKGGVGKTLSSISLAHHLSQEGRKVLYVGFEPGPQDRLLEAMNIPYRYLNIFESFEEYMGMRLHSKVLANWIVRSEFVRAVINIIPGMRYLFHLGHLLYLVKNDRELTII